MKLVIGLTVGLLIFSIPLGLFGLARFMWKRREGGRSFRFLSALFLSAIIYVLCWIIGASSVPESARGAQYEIALTVGLLVFAAGVGANVLYFIFEFWREDDTFGGTKTQIASGQLSEDHWIRNIRRILQEELEPSREQLRRIEERLLNMTVNGKGEIP